MNSAWTAWLPALGLLALLALLAWGVQWLRRRQQAMGDGGAALRVVAQLMVGPQQRVVVVELQGPGAPVQLTLGVTPQHVRTLHVQPLGARAPTPRYADVARTLAADDARREPAA
ncbi:MAG: flagellar biosynthetic protein FliO [Tepidimonas ignava]|uniref:Flagellar biosynthetic protein FliO n=1 Tax=Tepidimonas ignava TaxID=114249 RepID=A0A4V2UV65_9BURK|nr:flagellar biosynthetic protein FliO [Tepidimonas ignava]MCX7814181.1 flagellar biosynthetic protein FliO [Tepidimonas ignava]TCS94547.1 flagellar protein FliO/FliZ [Tepidimonas ignava]TSE18270.1 flagellar biosynthetic protein FliO [Tepidimonas ignava]